MITFPCLPDPPGVNTAFRKNHDDKPDAAWEHLVLRWLGHRCVQPSKIKHCLETWNDCCLGRSRYVVEELISAFSQTLSRFKFRQVQSGCDGVGAISRHISGLRRVDEITCLRVRVQ